MATALSKWQVLLRSRKFWAMVFGLVTLAIAYQFGHVNLESVELQALGILSIYILSVAVEDHGVAVGHQMGPVTLVVDSSLPSEGPLHDQPIPPSSPTEDRTAEALRILHKAGAHHVRVVPSSPPTKD